MYMYISTYMYIGVYACAYENIMYEYILVHIYNIYIYIYIYIYNTYTSRVCECVSVFQHLYLPWKAKYSRADAWSVDGR
jgi:hypothetical protein